MKINTISPQDHIFLQIIVNIAKPPKKLYFIGKLPDKRLPSVAIVGSRKPTSYGKEVTYQLAYDLARQGIVIISGMALGIDAIAHRAALDAGGITIAVVANGVDIIYPASNKDLYKQILANNGAIISEYEPGTEARDYQFLERNRIVSGLSDAVIVTEAAIKSGTLATVTHALDQGREVFVVPGNITSPLSAGCNQLIKQGAHPTTCASDVIEIIAPDLLEPQALLPLGSNAFETKIIQLLQSGIRDGDELHILSKMEISEFSNTITMLEISGIIRSLGGNQWTLR
jgi:DNA processing protein